MKRKREKDKKPRRIDRFFMDEQRSSTTTWNLHNRWRWNDDDDEMQQREEEERRKKKEEKHERSKRKRVKTKRERNGISHSPSLRFEQRENINIKNWIMGYKTVLL